MIEVKNLVKRYGSHLAVDHLNFTVEKGQIYGFLGPNGAGKSTTMNIITGYIASTEGTVDVYKRQVWRPIWKISMRFLPILCMKPDRWIPGLWRNMDYAEASV